MGIADCTRGLLGRGEFLQEGGDKQWYIALAFAQRGKLDLDNIEPEIQILAECSGLNRGIEVAICRGDDADVDAATLRRADRLYLTLLQGAQELGLQIHRHVADFVQKERAAVGGLEQTLLAMKRAGKRTLDVAEQLGFNQSRNEGRAIDGNKRLLFTRTREMHALGHQLLTCAALSQDQNRILVQAHLLDDFVYALHALGEPD